MIKFYNGLDGLKTGFTDNAGYCLTGTMLRNDMRLITVTMKAPTKEDRNTDTINLMEYAYSMYYKSTLIKKDKKIGDMWECPDLFEVDNEYILIMLRNI